MMKELMIKKMLANISELEIYMNSGIDSIKEKSKEALYNEIMDKYIKTKKIDNLSENDLKLINNYLGKKLSEIRDFE